MSLSFLLPVAVTRGQNISPASRFSPLDEAVRLRDAPVSQLGIQSSSTSRSIVSRTTLPSAAFAVGLIGAFTRRQRTCCSAKQATALRVRRTRSDQASQPTLPSLNSEDLRQLKFGLPVRRQERQGGKGSGFVVLDVNAPPELVLNCISSFQEYEDMIPSIRQAQARAIAENDDGTTTALMDYKISRFRLGISVQQTVDKAAGVVRFHLDPTATKLVLEEAQGFWYVEQAPGGNATKSRVWLCVDVQARKLLPHQIVDLASKSALAKATSWVKPVIEKKWRQQRVAKIWGEDVEPTSVSAPSNSAREEFARQPQLDGVCTA